MPKFMINRRKFLTASTVGAGLIASGCDAFDFLGDSDDPVRNFLEGANDLTYRVQRLLAGRDALAQEFSESDIRQPQRPNGVTAPDDETYKSLLGNDFADWRLEVAGLVERPLSLSRDQLIAMPAPHPDHAPRLRRGLELHRQMDGHAAGPRARRGEGEARGALRVFHCLDSIERGLSGDVKYYGSIDLIDARHPQTILAYGLNGKPLPVENGAPLRVRVERQLGYKMPKYIHRIELVDSFAAIGFGKGGYWEDRGYDWYGGI